MSERFALPNYDASRFALDLERLRDASAARCVGAPCSPPANIARQMAASQTRQPAPLCRQQQRQPLRLRRPGSRLHLERTARPRGPGGRHAVPRPAHHQSWLRKRSLLAADGSSVAGLRCGLGHALAPNVSVPTAQNPAPAFPLAPKAGPGHCADGTTTRPRAPRL